MIESIYLAERKRELELQKQKDDQERKKQMDFERQLERQRQIEHQKEEERRKLFEQREVNTLFPSHELEASPMHRSGDHVLIFHRTSLSHIYAKETHLISFCVMHERNFSYSM